MAEQNAVDEKEELFGGDSHGSPTLDMYSNSKELESGSDINTLDHSTFSSPKDSEGSGVFLSLKFDEGEFGRDAARKEYFCVRELDVFEDGHGRIIGGDSGGGGTTRGGVGTVSVDGGDSGGGGACGGVCYGGGCGHSRVNSGGGGSGNRRDQEKERETGKRIRRKREKRESGGRLSRWRKVPRMLFNMIKCNRW